MLKRRLATAVLSALLICGLDGGRTALVVAAPATSRAEHQSALSPGLKSGDLVRLRSGGPLMTVDKVDGDRVDCYWSTEYGDVRSASFRIADLTAPVTSPPPDPEEQRDEAATDRYFRQHCPQGFMTFEGKFQCAY
jgi:uncharacterized protein YodC (DUF2158 family)